MTVKIGIVSLYGWLTLWDNYGTLLQNYALQTFLRRHGHETFWIRTRPEAIRRTFYDLISSRFRGLAAYAIRWFRGPSRSDRIAAFNLDHPRQFGEFLERYVPTSDRDYVIAELRSDPPEVEALICGSDQIWRDVTPVNFLDFGPISIPRIAYAVSAPWTELGSLWMSKARDYVQSLTAVSVREKEGISICADLGRQDAIRTVDPTLLLSRDDYRQLTSTIDGPQPAARPYAFGYFVNVHNISEMPLGASQAFCVEQALDLWVVPLQGTELVIPRELVLTPTPIQWISAIDHAQCVLTNSYHGSLFAVVMQKPFLVFLQTGGKAAENCRFFSALQPLGLARRIVGDDEWASMTGADLNARMNESIDWERVSRSLLIQRESSSQFLLEALRR